jgi:hypothetical protein
MIKIGMPSAGTKTSPTKAANIAAIKEMPIKQGVDYSVDGSGPNELLRYLRFLLFKSCRH